MLACTVCRRVVVRSDILGAHVTGRPGALERPFDASRDFGVPARDHLVEPKLASRTDVDAVGFTPASGIVSPSCHIKSCLFVAEFRVFCSFMFFSLSDFYLIIPLL